MPAASVAANAGLGCMAPLRSARKDAMVEMGRGEPGMESGVGKGEVGVGRSWGRAMGLVRGPFVRWSGGEGGGVRVVVVVRRGICFS